MPKQKIRTAKKINGNWGDYDKTVAKCHLMNYGVIFLDEYGCPIDNEYVLEDLYAEYKGAKSC